MVWSLQGTCLAVFSSMNMLLNELKASEHIHESHEHVQDNGSDVGLPASMTSVARIMPSGSECRHPYTLSNLDLVTESLTLIAGNSSVLLACISYRRLTPVVVSSDTPWHAFAIFVHF